MGLILMFTRHRAASTKRNETVQAKQPTGVDSPPEQLYSASPKPPSVVFNEGIRSAGSPYGETKVSSALLWIEASESPFGIRVLDCRSVAYNMVSTTGDPKVAAKFTELRNSTGRHLRGSLPLQPLHADSFLKYPALGRVDGTHLFAAQVMEDKWDIFLLDGYLYFARSWTGDLIFRAKVNPSDSGIIISSIDANTQTVKGDRSLAIRQVDFLFKSHLLRQEVPHPLPGNFPADPQQIAAYSFHWFGRWGSYATYEDTTKARLRRGP
jgi:hypothetical protein